MSDNLKKVNTIRNRKVKGRERERGSKVKTTTVVMVTVMIQPACEGLGVEASNKTRGDDNTQYEEAPTHA